MLEKIELEKIAKEKGYSIKNIETDYLLEVLLFVIYREIGRQLVFKGGTALYKFYSLNRFSQDLDFTLNTSKMVGGLPVNRLVACELRSPPTIFERAQKYTIIKKDIWTSSISQLD